MVMFRVATSDLPASGQESVRTFDRQLTIMNKYSDLQTFAPPPHQTVGSKVIFGYSVRAK